MLWANLSFPTQMNDNQSNSPFGTELEPVPEEKRANYSHQKSGSNNYLCRVGSEQSSSRRLSPVPTAVPLPGLAGHIPTHPSHPPPAPFVPRAARGPSLSCRYRGFCGLETSARRRHASSSWARVLGGVRGGMAGSCTKGWAGCAPRGWPPVPQGWWRPGAPLAQSEL